MSQSVKAVIDVLLFVCQRVCGLWGESPVETTMDGNVIHIRHLHGDGSHVVEVTGEGAVVDGEAMSYELATRRVLSLARLAMAEWIAEDFVERTKDKQLVGYILGSYLVRYFMALLSDVPWQDFKGISGEVRRQECLEKLCQAVLFFGRVYRGDSLIQMLRESLDGGSDPRIQEFLIGGMNDGPGITYHYQEPKPEPGHGVETGIAKEEELKAHGEEVELARKAAECAMELAMKLEAGERIEDLLL